jgi:hypothetical protein
MQNYKILRNYPFKVLPYRIVFLLKIKMTFTSYETLGFKSWLLDNILSTHQRNFFISFNFFNFAICGSFWLRLFLQTIGSIRYKILRLKIEKYSFILNFILHANKYIFEAIHQNGSKILGVKVWIWKFICHWPKFGFRKIV